MVQVPYNDLLKLYNELLFAVARKWPGETRHQTALRYIQEREQTPPYEESVGCQQEAPRCNYEDWEGY